MSGLLAPIEKILLYSLNFFYGYVNNYGTAIIILTIVIRIILLPLTIKQMKSVKAMQKIQPELKKLQEKYKDDKEKLQKEMMKFYTENKVNPFGGCLPLLLQMPVFFALFQMLRSNKNLSKASFLWLSNLNKPDPYLILVVLMVITMYISQKMISSDPQQEKMMIPMTLFMAFIAFKLPAGVLIYWVTTNIGTIIQQYFLLKVAD
ncbi:MAG: membrane protein insertase YidC [Actinobacteria bacterium]|nr:membrane protein insertase YidC [Actinomycetota bacterium]